MSALSAFLRRLASKVWFRAALFTVAAVVFALAAGLIGAWLPFTLDVDLGQGSVDAILQIIATSMLAVTTFSLTVMVTAYSSATTIGTPRATQLLVQDPTSQNVLSSFIGAFVFSLVGIIALSTGYYTDQGRTILFFGTLVLVVIIVVTLLRWIAHLATFGRMADIIDRVEAAATTAACAFAEHPSLGGRVAPEPVDRSHPVHGERTGYVTHIDMAALQKAMTDAGATTIFVGAGPGRFVDEGTPLAFASAALSEDAHSAVCRAFRIEKHRTYDQDPRLGFIALAEIASRALSPAVNDPGTAIEVIGAIHRVFGGIAATPQSTETPFPAVSMSPVTRDDLVDDAFRPIARDGAGVIEVQLRLQKCLDALAVGDPAHGAVFRAAADRTYDRARGALGAADLAVLDAARR
jgi:uncharacterized membrane protein